MISSRVVNEELLGLLERNYRLSATRGTSVAGRSATLVTATRDDSPLVAARWWIDDATGIVLWEETYDKSGSLDLSFGSGLCLSAVRTASWSICRRGWPCREPTPR
jgi:hypothetical protein